MIREATLADAEAIGELMTQLGYPTSASQMRTRVERIAANPDYRTLVLERDGEIAGMIGLRHGRYYEHDRDYVQIAALVVAEDARGSGAGAELVKEAERWAAELGCRAVVVNSGNHRTGAHRFYESAGYSNTGRRFVKELR